jgi:arsenate reductase-like glutaredoxin family protein
MKFYLKPSCTSCRKAKAFLQERNAKLEEVDLNKGLSPAELEALIGERDYKLFLNTRNELYRERGMSKNPPPRKEAIQLMSEHPQSDQAPDSAEGSEDRAGVESGRTGKDGLRRIIKARDCGIFHYQIDDFRGV